MLSKITVDVAEDNQPVIRIKFQDSEDVRDTLIKRFAESFVGERWATIEFFYPDPSNPNNYCADIRPIRPGELLEELKLMKAVSSMKRPAPFDAIVDEQQSLSEAAKPLMEWMSRNNIHPHHTAIVTSANVELLEGVETGKV